MPYGLKDIELAKLNEVFAANERIERVILYGSRAKGNYKPFSDVDITLEGAELTHTDLSRLSLAIDDLLLPYQFDISIFHTLKNEALIDHIRRMGITIYERKSEWKEYKLGEISSFITEKILVQDVRIEDYISTENMLSDKGGITISLNKPSEGTATKYLEDTILVSNIRPYFKKIWYANKVGGCSNDVLCFKAKDELVFSKYLYFLLSQDTFFDYVMLGSKGCKMPRGDKSHIMNWEISLPSLPTQRHIAAILSSLDDKIDLLNRENATLEAMAETLFRQWFIEDAKEDWEEGKLGDWVVIKRGGSPRPINDYLSPTGYRWLKISDVTNLNSPYIFQTKEYIKESGLSKTVYLKKGSLVLSNSATPGIPKILCVDSCIHDGWLYFPKSTFSKIYLYLLFKYIRKDLVNLGNGSIFTNLKTDILKEYKVVKPDAKTMEVFDQQVQPIFDKLYSNETQIQTLIQTRDGLLPRLMSGEVKI